MDRPALTDANAKIDRKSDDSSTFEQKFWEVEVFLPQYDHCGSSDVGGLSRKIRLEQKSMERNFDVEVKNDEKMKIFEISKIDLVSFVLINYDVWK